MKYLASIFVFVLIAAYPALALAANTHATVLVSASSQYWDIADNASLSITGNLTLSVWFKATTLPSNDEMDLVTKFESSTGNRSYRIYIVDTAGQKSINCAAFSDGSSSNTTTYHANVTLSTGTWYLATCSYTAATPAWVIYLNGASQSVASDEALATSIFDSTARFGIGAVNVTGTPVKFFNGNIDEALIYNTNINSTVAGNLYTSPCTPSLTNLVSEWKFDNNGNDSVGSNTLSNNGVATFTASPAFSCGAAGGGNSLIFFGDW